MAIESLVTLGLATLMLFVIAIYANKHHSDDSSKRNKNNNDKQLGPDQKSLKAIALHLGVTESDAARIAINRLYLQLFHGGEEYDFPTAEQIKEMDAKYSTVNIVKTQTLAELLNGKSA